MRNRLQKLVLSLRALIAHADGQDLVEYAMLVALISIASIAGSHKVATAITTIFTNISTSLA